jgi:L-fuconolactonase
MDRRQFLATVAATASLAGAGVAVNGEQGVAPLPFPITDTHVHFWDPAHLRYAWLDGIPLLNTPYLPAGYIEAGAPHTIAKIVFVQAACAPEQALDEAKWVTELAETEPRIAAIVADGPLEQGERARPFLEALAAYPLARGIRRMLQGERDPEFCLQPDFVRGVQLLEQFAMSFDLGMRRDQLPAVAKLVDQCPNVMFIVNHGAAPNIRGREVEPWKHEIAELAKRPNVYCKLSGLATGADHAAWTLDDLRPYAEHVIEVFGFHRVAFGSDWPVMLQATPLARWIETVAALTEACTEDERRRLFVRTGAEFYRLRKTDHA